MTILLVLLVLLYAANPGDDRGKVETWEGYLALFGNEPFSRIALITDEQERLFLDLDRAGTAEIWSRREGRVRITGVLIQDYYMGKAHYFIRIHQLEWIPEQKKPDDP